MTPDMMGIRSVHDGLIVPQPDLVSRGLEYQEGRDKQNYRRDRARAEDKGLADASILFLSKKKHSNKMRYIYYLVALLPCLELGLAFVPSQKYSYAKNTMHSRQKIQIQHNDSRRASRGKAAISPNNDDSIPSRIRSAKKYFSRKVKSVLWPGSYKSDPDNDAPLPPSVSFGCPFIGNGILAGSQKDGPEYFYSKASAKLGHPSIWRFYFFGQPCTAVSGGDNVKAVLQNEYSKFDIMTMDFSEASREDDTSMENKKRKRKKKRMMLFSPESVMFERNKERHQFLRRLVGLALTPSAVLMGMPNIVAAANDQLDCIPRNGNDVKAQDLAENMALDIAQRQILGIELEEGSKEVQKFRKMVNAYVGGIFSISMYLPLPGKIKSLFPPYRARRYLVSKIEERIDQLEKSGPDGTTMSAMIFAEDGESGKKLTRHEVVENALILLVAGTETSASTLTSAIFLLGLHPHVWERLVQEQRGVCSTYGEEITKDVLAKHCPYLNAVVQETLRIVPLSGVNIRSAKETMVIDGKQIPKGHGVFPNIRLTHELDPVTRVDDSREGRKLHMDPRIGFLPERWLDESTRPSDDFLPFGLGPRRCIGYNLALAEIKVFLALMARRVESFDLVGTGSKGADESIRWTARSIIPKPADGVPIAATPLEV